MQQTVEIDSPRLFKQMSLFKSYYCIIQHTLNSLLCDKPTHPVYSYNVPCYNHIIVKFYTITSTHFNFLSIYEKPTHLVYLYKGPCYSWSLYNTWRSSLPQGGLPCSGLGNSPPSLSVQPQERPAQGMVWMLSQPYIP